MGPKIAHGQKCSCLDITHNDHINEEGPPIDNTLYFPSKVNITTTIWNITIQQAIV
jgi:hypothetical protein